MEIKLTHDATPALLGALNGLAGALRGITPTSQPVAVELTAPAAGIPATPAAAAPAPTPEPAAPVEPSPAAAPAAAPIPYTVPQINEACRPMIDADRTKMYELQRIIREQFGAQTLLDVPPERLGEFVQIIRGMGAQI